MKEVKQFLQKANIKMNNTRVRELFQVSQLFYRHDTFGFDFLTRKLLSGVSKTASEQQAAGAGF